MANIAVIGLVGRSMFFDVPRFHTGGETIVARGFHEEWGGKGFNQAVAAARQGAKVAFLGAVGMDDVEPLSKFCESECVDCLLTSGVAPSASAAILTDGSGETRVTVFPGAALSPADVECFRARIEAADVLLLNNEVPEEVNFRASEIAAANGVRIVFNRRMTFDPEELFVLSGSFSALLKFDPEKRDLVDWRSVDLVKEFTRAFPTLLATLNARTTLLVAQITSAAGASPLIPIAARPRETTGSYKNPEQ